MTNQAESHAGEKKTIELRSMDSRGRLSPHRSLSPQLISPPRLWPDRAIDASRRFIVKCGKVVAVVSPGEVCGFERQPRQRCAEVCRFSVPGAGDGTGGIGGSRLYSTKSHWLPYGRSMGTCAGNGRPRSHLHSLSSVRPGN